MLLFLALACGLTATDYPDDLSKAWCDYQEECTRSEFLQDFRDAEDCREEFLEGVDVDELEDCDFDAAAARECLAALGDATKSCDDDPWDSDCDDVYDCDGAVGLSGAVTPESFGLAFLTAACDQGCDDADIFCAAADDVADATSGNLSCDFDANAARDCLGSAFTCADNGAGGTFTLPPDICTRVCG